MTTAPDSSLAGQTAVVAGASSGVGLAVARGLAAAGMRTHALARRADLLEHARESCRELPGTLLPHAIDVTDRDAVNAFGARVGAEGDLRLLVVAVGVNLRERKFDQLSAEAWDHVLATNLTGAFNMVHALRVPLGAHGASDVVLVGSVSSAWPDHSGAAYQASKAGLLGFARALALETHGQGMRVTTLLPGMIDTPLIDSRPQPPGEAVRRLMLDPQDVADAAMFAVTLPRRANVAELTILPSALQAVGGTRGPADADADGPPA